MFVVFLISQMLCQPHDTLGPDSLLLKVWAWQYQNPRYVELERTLRGQLIHPPYAKAGLSILLFCPSSH